GFGDASFRIAVALTFVTLFGVGAARSAVTETRWWRAGTEMLIVGATAAAVAYGVGAYLASLVG
ncbi:MAG: VIT1/CCC1 transporter family protein, partial [Gemmatimonadales bacterium]